MGCTQSKPYVELGRKAPILDVLETIDEDDVSKLNDNTLDKTYIRIYPNAGFVCKSKRQETSSSTPLGVSDSKVFINYYSHGLLLMMIISSPRFASDKTGQLCSVFDIVISDLLMKKCETNEDFKHEVCYLIVFV